MNSIVVGIDASERARRALRWAAEEARLRGSRLIVIHVWSVPHLAYRDTAIQDDVIGAARRVAQDVIEDALEDLGAETIRGLEISHAIIEGEPAPALLEAAEDADLLVVGSRGRGGFTGLLLGSVSQHCAQHARCPVVIVAASRP